jgi:hypothetical protein
MRTLALLLVAAAGLTATTRASAESWADHDDEPGAHPKKKRYIEEGDTQKPML